MMFLAAGVAIAALAPTLHQERPDPKYMQHASYPAASPVKDPTAPGGFATCDRLPTRVKDTELLLRGLGVYLSKANGELTLRLVNGSSVPVWFRAADSDIQAMLEAKTSRGKWAPIEFHWLYTCGNSYHRVQLPTGHQWSFRIPVTSGSFKTKVRWSYVDEKRSLRSNEIDVTIPKERFELDPTMAAMYRLQDFEGLLRLTEKRQ